MDGKIYHAMLSIWYLMWKAMYIFYRYVSV